MPTLPDIARTLTADRRALCGTLARTRLAIEGLGTIDRVVDSLRNPAAFMDHFQTESFSSFVPFPQPKESTDDLDP